MFGVESSGILVLSGTVSGLDPPDFDLEPGERSAESAGLKSEGFGESCCKSCCLPEDLSISMSSCIVGAKGENKDTVLKFG